MIHQCAWWFISAHGNDGKSNKSNNIPRAAMQYACGKQGTPCASQKIYMSTACMWHGSMGERWSRKWPVHYGGNWGYPQFQSRTNKYDFFQSTIQKHKMLTRGAWRRLPSKQTRYWAEPGTRYANSGKIKTPNPYPKFIRHKIQLNFASGLVPAFFPDFFISEN